MSRWTYTRGLHDLGNAVYAYLQPDGGWGWSNAGIIVDGETSLLVDTLYDLKLTAEMLATMRRSLPAAEQIDLLVNTHANGDHCFGNQLAGGAQIIASVRTAEEMPELPPANMAMLMKQTPFLGAIGELMQRCFGAFEFEDTELVLPQRTFEGQLDLRVGAKDVSLLEVGPAHTRGDTLVYVPGDRVVFTGDILFSGCHPIMWAGPVGNWIRACERILALDVETVVPGHGPIADKQGVAGLRDYWAYLFGEVQRCHQAGLTPLEAALEIPMDAYSDWRNAERIVVSVASIYRELNGETEEAASVPFHFALMAEFARQKGL